MSFSREIKDELSRHEGESRHCRIAELSALFSFCGGIQKGEDGEKILIFHTENRAVARKCFTLLEKTFNIKASLTVRKLEYRNRMYSYAVSAPDICGGKSCAEALRPSDSYNRDLSDAVLVHPLLIQRECCRRAFIRGAFLAVGSVSDPSRFYHLEFVCPGEDWALQLRDMVNSFGLDAKVTARKKSFILYIKEGDQLVDLLNIMEAHVALMKLENVRIMKGVRNSVNRQVNCDAANIHKTVSAAQEQIRDIICIRDTIGLAGLPEGLAEIARVRLEQPQATLKELGELLDPPVGKSGVNHRLKKLKEMAEQLRKTDVEERLS